MNYGGPYRISNVPPVVEEDLWLRLDDALVEAMRDPAFSWAIGWNVLIDAQRMGFTDVAKAAASLIEKLFPMPPEWHLPDGPIDIDDR